MTTVHTRPPLNTKGMKVFTTGQIAAFCKVAPKTVSNWIDKGLLKGYRIPGSNDRRVDRADLIRFLKENSMPLRQLESEAKRKVLLIECSKEVARQITIAARNSFVLPADNLVEAGMIIGTDKPDVVLVDFSIGTSSALLIPKSLPKDYRQSSRLIALLGEDATAEQHKKALAAGYNLVQKHPVDYSTMALFMEGGAE